MDLPLNEGDLVADCYLVERVVGVGGMAVVAVASHTTALHRVAIKMLLPQHASHDEVVKRFEREQDTLMQLHSEHTLRIYGAGTHGSLPFMLVDYLEGDDLAELIKKEGPLPVERAVEYILQACHAIAEAHALGITHRDLKPGNLFLVRRHDGSPCIKVLDFGISKVTYERVTDEPSLTKTTTIMGSPFYMSPEQMLSSRDVDARTDIWALGVTLYELLTKALPFAAETPMQVCRRIMHDEPTPLRKLRPLYPKGLEDIIRRCLQRHPDRRYPNIADLATRLADFGPEHGRFAVESICELVEPSEPQDQVHLVNEEPAPSSQLAGGDTTIYLQGDQGGSKMRTIWSAGLAAATFAMGVGVGWVMSLPTDPTTHRAVLPAEDAAEPAKQPRATQPSVETTKPSEPIDLDDPPAAVSDKGTAHKGAAGAPTRTAGAAPTARPRPSVSAKSPPPLDETIEPGPTPLPSSSPAPAASDIEF